MLEELHITNFALIDDLRAPIGEGFSVLTGETGAGKSIVVDALNAALGERTGSEVVRTGADSCLVEAVFDASDCPGAIEAACAAGIPAADGKIILSREINSSGRSQCRVNGRAVTSSTVRQITAGLIDVHGQHEHQSLLSVPLHVDLLDAWAGDEVAELREQARLLHAEMASLRADRERLQTDERERARMLDLYRFQLSEIESAKLDPDEERELEAEWVRLANAEKLSEAAAQIYEALSGAESSQGAVDTLGTAAVLADRLAQTDPSVSELVEEINNALFGAQEALAAIRDYRDSVDANPARLVQVEERLELIRALKRKYGDTLEEVIEYAAGLGGKIEELSSAEERSRELDAAVNAARERLVLVCADLTSARSRASSGFEEAVERELADLAMDKTRFQASIQPAEPGPKGADAVEFLISPNAGEPVKPLARIASGGEMSRIMLALKTVMSAAAHPAPAQRTLVFDEIDTGIGGRTAQVLGEKLASLARGRQVLCVTHLPQIAGKAANHYCVEKVVRDGRTSVRLRLLRDEERVAELARMLGGQEGSETAERHAREMLSLADKGNSQA